MQCFVQVFPDVVRKAPGKKFVENYTERIDITARVELQRIRENLLGTHICEGADKLADIGLHGGLSITVRDTRDAEVENLRLSRLINQNVAWLEIAMDQATLMRVMNGIA